MDFSHFARQMMGGQPPARTPGSPFPLQLTDLWSSSAEPDYPEPPTYLTQPGELPEAERKRLRRDNILKVLAAALGGPPGQMGTSALAATAERGQDEQRAVDRQNSIAQQQFSAERQRAALQAETMRTRAMTQKEGQQAKSVIGKAQHLWELAADDPNLQGRIVSAAQRGPDAMEELSKLEASLPGRQALRKAGVDPDDPMQVEAAKAKAKAALEEQERIKTREAEEKLKREHELWLKQNKLGTYDPTDRGPREGTILIASDGSPFLVDQVSGSSRPVSGIPGGVRQGTAGLDPWREAVRKAQADARAYLVPNDAGSIRARANEYYKLQTEGPGPGGPVGIGGPPLAGSGRAPAAASPPAPPPAPKKQGGNARLIPGVKGAAAGGDFSGVSDPKAKAWAEGQLAAGIPRATIEAQLRKWGAL